VSRKSRKWKTGDGAHGGRPGGIGRRVGFELETFKWMKRWLVC
jgi:hypothetical protein